MRNIDAAVFFGGDPASPDTYGKFYSDVEMFTNGSNGTDPETTWVTGQPTEISGASNNWLGNNVPRFCIAKNTTHLLADNVNETAVLEERAAIGNSIE